MPGAGAKLRLASDGATIETLEGQGIGRVVRGIPRFVSDEHLDSFGHQWTTFDVAHDDEDRATFEAKTGVRLADLKGLRVLDAGCGGGRYARICGEAGAIVVGADHTRAVDKARQICSHLPNVQFVQADLKHLPLEAASFDFVFSIGVMHHDFETRLSSMPLLAWLNRGTVFGLAVPSQSMVAGIDQQRTALCDNSDARQNVDAVLSPGRGAGIDPIINRTLNKVVNFSAHPSYQNRVCDTFDWWAPKYQHHHTVLNFAIGLRPGFGI